MLYEVITDVSSALITKLNDNRIVLILHVSNERFNTCGIGRHKGINITGSNQDVKAIGNNNRD